MRPKVFITHRTFPEVLEYLKPHAEVETESPKDAWTPDALASRIRDKHGILTLLVDPVTADVMDAAQDLKIVANCAVGFDNIDILHARKKGILVTNTPGVLTETTADLTWALILAVARKIPQAHAFTRAGKYMGWRLDLFLGQEVTGKRLGIVGMGRIGRAVASRAKAFRMEVVYSDPHRL
ncbi:MAG: NAD(P)-dependent oxidoreductase, partial [Candidatus Aminicenantales bacterium]